jgi:pimeloyl-ACP methyl ester carboxylesterase
VIWGDLDAIVPYANAAKVKRAIPQLQLTTIKGGRHAIPYTEAELVAAVLAPFFTAAPEE